MRSVEILEMFTQHSTDVIEPDKGTLKDVIKEILDLGQAYEIMPQILSLFKVKNLFDNLFPSSLHTIVQSQLHL